MSSSTSCSPSSTGSVDFVRSRSITLQPGTAQGSSSPPAVTKVALETISLTKFAEAIDASTVAKFWSRLKLGMPFPSPTALAPDYFDSLSGHACLKEMSALGLDPPFDHAQATVRFAPQAEVRLIGRVRTSRLCRPILCRLLPQYPQMRRFPGKMNLEKGDAFRELSPIFGDPAGTC